ncbi:hypothetical protein [Ralstonia phage RP13]|nr:hypothetical protein [Ralstonia phage RP13]
MTKRVRIENADTYPKAIKVTSYYKHSDALPNPTTDQVGNETILRNAADLLELHVHQGMYLVVTEA